MCFSKYENFTFGKLAVRVCQIIKVRKKVNNFTMTLEKVAIIIV